MSGSGAQKDPASAAAGWHVVLLEWAISGPTDEPRQIDIQYLNAAILLWRAYFRPHAARRTEANWPQ